MRHTKLLLSIAVLTVFLVGAFAYLLTSGYFANCIEYESTAWGYKIAIKQVSFDNSTPNKLWVDASLLSNPGRTAVFTTALVKNSTNHVVAGGAFEPNVLQANSNMTRLTVNLNATLPSGTYTAVLLTEEGGNFHSPSFSVP